MLIWMVESFTRILSQFSHESDFVFLRKEHVFLLHDIVQRSGDEISACDYQTLTASLKPPKISKWTFHVFKSS
jgi:hypothetical protein